MSGCGKPWQNPGPDEAFENFLLDLYMRKTESAFESLRSDDRERLTKALEDLEGKVPEDALPERTHMLVTGRVDNPYDIKNIEYDEDLTEEPEEGTVVELTLEYHDARKGSARVVWGGDRWYIDLPDSVARSKTADEDAEKQEAARRGAAVADALIQRLRRHIEGSDAIPGSDGAGKMPSTQGDE